MIIWWYQCSREQESPQSRKKLQALEEFVLDTGSGISLIQPGVYPSEVKPTTLSPFGVTERAGDKGSTGRTILLRWQEV
jgi:hypothetical protein